MIIFIISVAVLLVGIGLLIWYHLDRDAWSGDWKQILGGALTTVGILACSISGVPGIIENSSRNKFTVRTSLNNTIEELNNTYSYLKTSEDTISRLEVTTYNEKVKEFKTKIAKKQYTLSSPWINWFACPVYAEFTGNEVSYLK